MVHGALADVRYFIIYITLLLTLRLEGQDLMSLDTVKIDEVVIAGEKHDIALQGFSVISIDSAMIRQFSHGTVADAISFNSAIYIKSYGSGGAATSSLRGTGASGTQVTWNGMNIDNPMLGQSDLSVFSAGITDKIEILYGGASMVLSSGASGGIISLSSNPSFSERTSITLKPAAGSFGKYSGQLSVETGTSGFQSVTKAFYQSSENNFSYIDDVTRSAAFREIRRNNEVSQKGFIQDIYRKTSAGKISAHIWYQDARRNLPSSILTEYAGESQQDQSVRTVLSFENDSRFSISGSWMLSNLNYRNKLVQIDSRNQVQAFFLKTKYNRSFSNKINIGFLFNEQLNHVISNNYSGKESRNTADAAVTIENINSERIRGSLLVRQILFGKELLVPDFSTGIRIKPFLARKYFIRYNISRNSRIPTMNDLYWNPGGNPDLKNEYALMNELSFGAEYSKMPVFMQYEIALFHNSIKDMIQWRPGDFSYWSASNIKNAITKGIETSALLSYKSGKWFSVFRINYSLTRASGSDDTWKQLIYVPENMANCTLRMKYGMFYSSWLTNLTGLRFTTEDNTDYLPAYSVSSLTAGIERITGWGSLDISLGIDNVFNADYQNIAYYPLPGRTFELRLLAQTIFKK